jgi:hypothetical protein
MTTTATAIQLSALALLVGWVHPGAVGAQERFPRVQYVAGRPELVKPTEVTLVLDDRELRVEQTVYSDRGSSVRTAFTIPLMTIIAVGASPRSEAGDLVLTGPFGVSSSLNQEEYVTLTLQSGDRIDAVVFKVGRQQSAAIAAKIESATERAFEPPSSRPAKARAVRAHRRPLRLVKVIGRTATPPRDGFRKSRARGGRRGAADHRHIERT